MKIKTYISCLWLVASIAHAAALDVSLKINKDNGRCILHIKNISSEPVTILTAFDRRSGMSDDLPIGTSYNLEGSDEWINCYMISSSFYDTGPGYTTNEKGEVIAGARQPTKALAPKEKISTEFSLKTAIRWMWDHVEKKENGEISLKHPFYLKAGVWVQISLKEYEFIQTESSEILTYTSWFKPK